MTRTEFLKNTFGTLLLLGGVGCFSAKKAEARAMENAVLEIVKAKSQNEFVKWDDNFVRNLGMDSLDTVEVILEAEKKFGIKYIPDIMAEQIQTPRELLDAVKVCIKNKY